MSAGDLQPSESPGSESPAPLPEGARCCGRAGCLRASRPRLEETRAGCVESPFSSFFKSSRWRWASGSGRNGGFGWAVAAGGSPWSWWAVRVAWLVLAGAGWCWLMLFFPPLPSFETQRNGLVFIYDMAGSQYTNFELDLSKKILNLLKVAAPRGMPGAFCTNFPTPHCRWPCLCPPGGYLGCGRPGLEGRRGSAVPTRRIPPAAAGKACAETDANYFFNRAGISCLLPSPE